MRDGPASVDSQVGGSTSASQFIPSTGIYSREGFSPADLNRIIVPQIDGMASFYTWFALEPFAPQVVYNSGGDPVFVIDSTVSQSLHVKHRNDFHTLIGTYPSGFSLFVNGIEFTCTVANGNGDGVIQVQSVNAAHDGEIIPIGAPVHYYAFHPVMDADLTIIQTVGKKAAVAITQGSCRIEDGTANGLSNAVPRANQMTPSWLASPTGDGVTQARSVTVMWAQQQGGSPTSGASTNAWTHDIVEPWDPFLLAQYKLLVNAYKTYLKNSGFYETIGQIKLSMFNNDTAETRIPSQNYYTTDTIDSTAISIVIAKGSNINVTTLQVGDNFGDTSGSGNLSASNTTNLNPNGTAGTGAFLRVPTNTGEIVFSYNAFIAGPKLNGCKVISITPGSTSVANGAAITFAIPDANPVWQAAGYTRSKMLSALQAVTQIYADAFPDKQLWNAMLENHAVPSIDELGNIVDLHNLKSTDAGYSAGSNNVNLHEDNVTTLDYIRWACLAYGRRFMVCRTDLDETYTPISTHPTINLAQALGGSVGFQVNDGKFGDSKGGTSANLYTAIANGLQYGMYYLEIFRNTHKDFPDPVAYASTILSGPQQMVPVYTPLVDAATVTPVMTSDGGFLTTLSQTTTFASPVTTGLVNGRTYTIRVKSASAQNVSFGAKFRAGTSPALPTTTTGSAKTDYWTFRYNNEDDKLDLVGLQLGF